MGISKKRFEGWEPATEHEHDDDGRVVASRPETEWDARQRGWMLALDEFEGSRCPCGCGHNVAETTAKEGTHRWKARKVRCHARTAMVAAQTAAAKKNVAQPEARLWWADKER